MVNPSKEPQIGQIGRWVDYCAAAVLLLMFCYFPCCLLFCEVVSSCCMLVFIRRSLHVFGFAERCLSGSLTL